MSTKADQLQSDTNAGDPQLRHVDRAWASTVHAFQGRTVDNVIAAIEANHPNLTNQKMLYVEISRARDRAELVTDDKAALKEQPEALSGERIAALEAIGEEKAKGQDEAAGRESGATKLSEIIPAREREADIATIGRGKSGEMSLVCEPWRGAARCRRPGLEAKERRRRRADAALAGERPGRHYAAAPPVGASVGGIRRLRLRLVRKAMPRGDGEKPRGGRPEADGKGFDRKSGVAGRKRFGRDSAYGMWRRSAARAVGARLQNRGAKRSDAASRVEDRPRGRGGKAPVTVAAGEAVYGMGGSPCSGVGLRWSDGEMNAAMDGRIAAVLFDDEGKADIEEILAGLAETEFEQAGLRHVLQDPDRVEDWRVGEAIAEAYLTYHRSCTFPWPDGRDERKSGSSLPGADLVGFGIDEDGDCFAFGEVKTSREAKYPPGTMRGRTGLKRQLEDLRDRNAIRADLVKYLGHRAGSASWLARFRRATKRYVGNPSDVQLYGVLVRDVEPHQDDVRARVDDLGAGCPEGTRIELLALYLPRESLEGIGEEMVARRAGGNR